MAFRALIWLGIIAFFAWRYWQRAVAAAAVQPNAGSGPPAADPWVVLGVPRGASAAAVRAAYQKAMQLYHPDQVAHLGPDLQVLAEQRTKAITAAYAKLRPGRRRP